jgi:hypothetical protein
LTVDPDVRSLPDRELLILVAERVRTLSEQIKPMCDSYPRYQERVDTHIENHRTNTATILVIAGIIATLIAAIVPRFVK